MILLNLTSFRKNKSNLIANIMERWINGRLYYRRRSRRKIWSFPLFITYHLVVENINDAIRKGHMLLIRAFSMLDFLTILIDSFSPYGE